jgi:hypothetical protein
VTIPFNIPHLSNQGSRLIAVELNPESKNVALIYPLPEPGWYTLQLRYQYTGPDAGKLNVFRGKLPSNPVSFLVRDNTGHPTHHPIIIDEGNPEFQMRARDALDAIRNSSPAGQAAIDRLKQSF